MDLLDEARGFRNNNPGNIRKTTIDWKGEVKGDDSDFETFDCVEYGIRAIFKLLYTYHFRRGCHNIREIIYRWAPPSENDSKKYVLSVLYYMSRFSDKALKAVTTQGENVDPFKEGVVAELVAAIINHENGAQPFNKDFLEKCSTY